MGGGEGCDERKHMEKQIFPLPAAVGGRQMSACAASTLDCAALGTTTWPSLLSHRVWAAVTLRNFSPGWALGTVEGVGGGCGGVLPRSGSSTCTRVHQHLLDPLLFFTQETHKETLALFTLMRKEESDLEFAGEERRGEDTCVVLSPRQENPDSGLVATLKLASFKGCVTPKTYCSHICMCIRHHTFCKLKSVKSGATRWFL